MLTKTENSEYEGDDVFIAADPIQSETAAIVNLHKNNHSDVTTNNKRLLPMSHQQGKDVPTGYFAAYHQVAGAQQKKTNKLAPVHSFATTQKSTSKSKSYYAAHDRLLMPSLKYNGDGLIQLQQESNVLMMTKPNNNNKSRVPARKLRRITSMLNLPGHSFPACLDRMWSHLLPRLSPKSLEISTKMHHLQINCF